MALIRKYIYVYETLRIMFSLLNVSNPIEHL